MEEVSIRDDKSHYMHGSPAVDGLHVLSNGSKECCSVFMVKDKHSVSMTLYKHDVEALAAILSAIAKNMETKS